LMLFPAILLSHISFAHASDNDNTLIDADPPIILSSYGMVLPQPRPDPRSVFPETEPSLRIFIEVNSGIAINTDESLYRLKSGEGLSNLLNRAGFNGKMRESAIQHIKSHRSLRKLPVGFPVYAIAPTDYTPGGIRISLGNDQDLSLYYDIENDEWRSIRSFRPYEYSLTYVSGDIENSLYTSGINAGMTDAMFNDFIHIMSFSVDFQRQIRSGDHFEALIEYRRDLITDKTVPGGEIYYLSMNLSGEKIEYFRHQQADGGVGYYDRQGVSAYRTLMRTPINGARLSSGFGNRKHPILGYTKAHRGADFSAPTGTPIMAAGDGLVEYAGWNGSYGRYVRVVHNGTFKTAYAHMSGISKGIRSGARVNQGDIIGYVGSSGRSTGPHLHYEIIVNGSHVNPLTVELPSSEPLTEIEKNRLAQNIEIITKEMSVRGIINYASNQFSERLASQYE
jgi:murein DD-endopeptidase MepM/ murein hydrolase activator NlpD